MIKAAYRSAVCAYFLMFLLPVVISMAACKEEKKEKRAPRKQVDYIKKIEGPSDSIPASIAQRGEVLVAYADCYECHKKTARFIGPAFEDIAKRYPVNDGYIKLLGLRIINGGSGAWGNVVMRPHPNLTQEDAETMAKFILSLKKE
ncbi:c-type cytochrome [Flavihumibacter petaseus]|uniref:Putative cytochrome c n=1 Tax=Flavihumibacter petaseus NBRC 106054 TaxID=1220578 RepID=A0A0E9MXP8_9BACT|nr:c-type cytochrome [Flavihumibacter petaseus]GAO42288.1 putative cytochrome c [Flavihumibacter petaseus NBRC 106054]